MRKSFNLNFSAFIKYIKLALCFMAEFSTLHQGNK